MPAEVSEEVRQVLGKLITGAKISNRDIDALGLEFRCFLAEREQLIRLLNEACDALADTNGDLATSLRKRCQLAGGGAMVEG